MTDRDHILRELNKLRGLFPDMGFVVVMYDTKQKEFSGWSNMQDPVAALKHLDGDRWENWRNPEVN